MPSPTFIPLPTGDRDLDRIQKRLQIATTQGRNDTTSVADQIPATGTVSTFKTSGSISVTDTMVRITVSGVTVSMPDATQTNGRSVRIVNASGGNITLQGLVRNGFRQTINGTATVTIVSNGKVTLTSNGKTWSGDF